MVRIVYEIEVIERHAVSLHLQFGATMQHHTARQSTHLEVVASTIPDTASYILNEASRNTIRQARTLDVLDMIIGRSEQTGS